MTAFACSNPRTGVTKRGYRRRRDALKTARGADVALRVYRCECGQYHLTSAPARPGQTGRNTR
jgi:hypothetical protein